MVDVTYGLRDPATGRFLRMRIEPNDGREFCGSETVELVEFDERFDTDYPIYEVRNIKDVLYTLSEDQNWYNTSRERPGHGRVSVEDYDIVMFEREAGYGVIGGDPVTRAERVTVVPVPDRYSGVAYTTREKSPDRIMSGIFGEAWTERRLVSAAAAAAHYLTEGEPEPLIPFIVDRSKGGALEEGMLVKSSLGNLAQVVAIERLPDTWPMDIGRDFAQSNDLVLVLCRTHDIVMDVDGPKADRLRSPGM